MRVSVQSSVPEKSPRCVSLYTHHDDRFELPFVCARDRSNINAGFNMHQCSSRLTIYNLAGFYLTQLACSHPESILLESLFTLLPVLVI
jgi:hypothetical protein